MHSIYVAMRYEMASVSVCHEWLSKKCVIAALTTRWHSALRQIPRGLSVPQRTPSPSEKLRETMRGRGTDSGRERLRGRECEREREAGRERERDLCSSVSVYCV